MSRRELRSAQSLPSLVLLLSLFGCGGPTSAAPSDAGSGALSPDASPEPTPDAAADVATDAVALTPLVIQCQQLARNFQTKCVGSDSRPCFWGAYAELCVTGQTQLLVDSMSCLDSTTCRTFSDPNDGAACLAKVHTSGESAEAKSFLQAECTACNESCPTTTGTGEIFPYLTDSDLESLSSCSATLCTYFSGADAGGAACPANADLAPFSACL